MGCAFVVFAVSTGVVVIAVAAAIVLVVLFVTREGGDDLGPQR
jgi:hypothetical protein